MIVCHCNSVSDRAIRAAVQNGAHTRNEVGKTCATSLICGGCALAVDEIIENEMSLARRRNPTRFRDLAVLS